MEGNSLSFTLNHLERLKFRKQIETLFQNGEAFSVYPFRVVYALVPRVLVSDAPARIGFSVPKKKMKHAHQRNRIKRLAREAWRHEKHAVYALIPNHLQLHFFVIFTGKETPDWPLCQKVFQKMVKTFSSGIICG